MNAKSIVYGDGRGNLTYKMMTVEEAREAYAECRRRIRTTEQKYVNYKRGMPFNAVSEVRCWKAQQDAIIDVFGGSRIIDGRN